MHRFESDRRLLVDLVSFTLQQWSDGDQEVSKKLMPLLYMRQERTDHALQTTALINEAYLRLVDWKNILWHWKASSDRSAATPGLLIIFQVAGLGQT